MGRWPLFQPSKHTTKDNKINTVNVLEDSDWWITIPKLQKTDTSTGSYFIILNQNFHKIKLSGTQCQAYLSCSVVLKMQNRYCQWTLLCGPHLSSSLLHTAPGISMQHKRVNALTSHGWTKSKLTEHLQRPFATRGSRQEFHKINYNRWQDLTNGSSTKRSSNFHDKSQDYPTDQKTSEKADWMRRLFSLTVKVHVLSVCSYRCNSESRIQPTHLQK